MRKTTDHRVRVMLRRRIETAKFGLTIPAYSERVAHTEDFKRFFVEYDDEGTIRILVDGKDVDIIDHNPA